MSAYNPENERIKKAYFRSRREAKGRAASTIDGIRKSISRYEEYTGRKNFKTFNKEQAIGFKAHLARTPSARSGQPLAISTQVAIVGALKEFFRWVSYQPGYRSRVLPTDIDYLNLSDKDTRAATAPRFKTFPTLEQVKAVIFAMPTETEVQRRDRAVVTMAILTGARDGALASLRLKHVDLTRKLVMQDPREVRTKQSKRVVSYFCPLGEDLEAIIADWIKYLREVKLYGNDDPVFPRTCVRRSEDGVFVADGLEPILWENSQPIRVIFRKAFANAGLPYFRPHSFRDTLVQYGERNAANIEQFKALSQNLGHEHASTTLTSYGTISTIRQGELVRSMRPANGQVDLDPKMQQLFGDLVRRIRQEADA
jgi:integrase